MCRPPRGYVQGYNAEAAATETQIVIAADVTIASSDFEHLEPMVSATQTEQFSTTFPQRAGCGLRALRLAIR